MPALIKPSWFLLRFGLWTLAGEALFFVFIADGPVFARYLALHAQAVSGLLEGLGFQSEVHGAALSVGGSAFEVARGCDVTRPIGLLIAAILAFPARLRSKGLAILVGVSLLWCVNLLRILSLILVSHSAPERFDALHFAVWPLLLILSMLWFWATWARRELGANAARRAPSSGTPPAMGAESSTLSA